MLDKVIKALSEYQQQGVTVVETDAEYDCKEVADVVLLTLRALKCDYEVMHDIVSETTIIRDCMSEN